MSSSGHEYSGILFDDLNLKKGGYDMWKGYGQSKTANIYLANEVRYTDILHSSALVASPVVKTYCALRWPYLAYLLDWFYVACLVSK